MGFGEFFVRLLSVKAIVEILLLSFFFYYIALFIRGTRAVQVLKGIILVGIVFVVAKTLRLNTISFLLESLATVILVFLIIVFQPELRRALARLGRRPLFRSPPPSDRMVDVIAETVMILSKKKIGALIAIEREIGLRSYADTGIRIDGQASIELLSTIFMPYTALHDGGVIIDEDRIEAASCLFPLSHRARPKEVLGMRHRSALGLSEESDALVIVVSEETGGVRVAQRGALSKNIDIDALRSFLKKVYIKSHKSAGIFQKDKR